MSNDRSKAVDALISKGSVIGLARKYLFAAFAAIAFYNAIELVVLCLVSFKRRRGCYFWSLLVASASVVPYTLGFVLLFFPTGVSIFVCMTLITVFWCGMVTGQSLVLWSRLHLLLQNRKLLLGLLWMIIIDAVLLHVPTIVLVYGVLATFSDIFIDAYNIMEHIQVAWFCVQELIISAIYVWETVKLLRLRPQGLRYRILRQLLAINIFILILDVAVVGIEYAGFYGLQVTLKPAVYSIKLKLEFAILGRLVAIVHPSYDSENPLSSRGILFVPSSQEIPMHETRTAPIDRNGLHWYELHWFWKRRHQLS